MKLATTRAALLPALVHAHGAVGRSSLPILEHLLLRVSPAGELEVTGSDLETQISSRASVDNAEAGAIAAPGRKLLDIVRLQPETADLTMELAGDRLTVRCGRSRYQLATMPAESYPDFDAGDTEKTVSLPAATLLEAIQRTRFAIGINDVRYYLNGLAMQLLPGLIRTVASDGHRLALSELPIENDMETTTAIVPRKGIDGLLMLLKHEAKPDLRAAIGVGDRSVAVELGTIRFASKRVEGAFPDYNRVLPKHVSQSFQVSSQSLLTAVARVAVLAEQEYQGIAINFERERLVLQSRNVTSEEASEEVAITAMEGEATRVGYRANYLIDALRIVSSEETEIGLAASGACMISEPGNDNWRTVVMPMRL